MNIFNPLQNRAPGPRVEMIRHDLKRRWLRVEGVQPVTPGMLRINFSGEDLGDFTSLAFDDHVKIFVSTVSGEVERRDYTPRRFDRQSRSLVIDFAVHEAGPATRWAVGARPGDQLQIGGPKGSKIIVGQDVRRWLLVGDETALPAIGRHIEQAGPGVEITSVIAVADPRERQDFATEARHRALWAYRPLTAADDPGALISVLERLEIAPDTFIWIAGEARVARGLRNEFLQKKNHPAAWMKAAGYWVKGRADAHERIQ